MPKLDGTHLPERIRNRLADLKAGKEVAAKEIKALLSEDQFAAMNAAWQYQKELRTNKSAKGREEKNISFKTKREIHIEAYEAALIEANKDLLNSFRKRQLQSEVRAASVYIDAFKAAKAEGKTRYQADLVANNELKRAHLAQVEKKQLSHRDKEVEAMESKIKAELRKKMSPSELEQLEVLEEHDAAVAKASKKARRK